MIYTLDGLFGIGFSISQALRTLMGEIIALIYSLIDYLYTVFIYLSRAEILENDFIQSIYSKVGMILGIFMVFKLVFSLIQSLLDPNKFTDKKTGFTSIISRCVISIVLLGVTPAIFREAFTLQNLIVGGSYSDNVIYKLIAGQSSVGNAEDMGRVISSDLYFTFFADNESPKLSHGVNDDIYENNSDDANYYDRFIRNDYDTLVSNVKNNNMSFHDTVSYLSIKNEATNQYIIEFNWLLLLVVGCFMVWMIGVYCIQVAVRVVQLAYLQLVAPVPILSYISDPDGTFQKWLKQCTSTYLDLFFRLAIIYFVMTMIGDVLNQFTKMGGIIFDSTGISTYDWMTLGIVKIFIILGLLLFAKKVPELIKDLFPKLGGGFSFGLGIPKEVSEIGTFAAGTAAGAIGGLATGIRYGDGFGGKFAGAFAGLGRGIASGMKTKGNPFANAGKGMAAQRSAAMKAYERNRDGSTFFGRTTYGSYQASLAKEAYDKELQAYSDYEAYVGAVDKELEKNARVQAIMAEKDRMIKTGTITFTGSRGIPVTRKVTEADIEAMDKQVKTVKKAVLEDEISKFNTADANVTLQTAMMSAETVRAKGQNSGYAGFGNTSINDSSNASASVDAFYDNKNSSKSEAGNIKNPGGSRNAAYKQVSANAKYKK